MSSLDQARVAEIDRWIIRAGLTGTPEADLLVGFCTRARAAGIALTRAVVVIDTLHPVHEGHAFRWRSDQAEDGVMLEYGRTNQGGEAADNWRESPFYTMTVEGQSSLHRRLSEAAGEYRLFGELRAAGQTGYLALIHRFGEDNAIAEIDCVYSSWITDRAEGFAAEHVEALMGAVPSLALAVKAASLARVAETLVETYLGRDAGRRVLAGHIERGVAERIEAALWFSDLRGYTRITGAAPPDQIIPLLNDYAEAIISAVHDVGGDVLKLIGDGILAIFNSDTQAEACRCSLAAEKIARQRIEALNERRTAKGLPVTEAYIGLHVGEVFYGNIGSRERLDFTVVGPAVNEASRIAAMCRSAERNVLASSAFAAAAFPDDRKRLVSVGRYALRGVQGAQELFTLESGRDTAPAPPVT